MCGSRQVAPHPLGFGHPDPWTDAAGCTGRASVFTVPRKHHQAGQGAIHVINYRHVIGSLKTRPGALLTLVYQDELFPRAEYQHCFETAVAALVPREGCRLTVTLLAMAHDAHCEIAACLNEGTLPCLETLRARLAPQRGEMPELNIEQPQLAAYSTLLTSRDLS